MRRNAALPEVCSRRNLPAAEVESADSTTTVQNSVRKHMAASMAASSDAVVVADVDSVRRVIDSESSTVTATAVVVTPEAVMTICSMADVIALARSLESKLSMSAPALTSCPLQVSQFTSTSKLAGGKGGG